MHKDDTEPGTVAGEVYEKLAVRSYGLVVCTLRAETKRIGGPVEQERVYALLVIRKHVLGSVFRPVEHCE